MPAHASATTAPVPATLCQPSIMASPTSVLIVSTSDTGIEYCDEMFSELAPSMISSTMPRA